MRVGVKASTSPPLSAYVLTMENLSFNPANFNHQLHQNSMKSIHFGDTDVTGLCANDYYLAVQVMKAL